MQLFLEALDQVARILLGSDLSSVPSHSSATYVDPNVLWDHCCHLSEVGSSLILLLGLPPELYPCGSSPPAHPSGSEKSTYLQAEHGICVSSELCLYPELPASTRCYCPVAHWRCQNHLCFLPLCPPSRTPVRLPGLFYFPSKCLLASSLTPYPHSSHGLPLGPLLSDQRSCLSSSIKCLLMLSKCSSLKLFSSFHFPYSLDPHC